MPDTKITALAAITTVDPAADVLPIVDISDTSMAASGTTKKITSNQILGAGGTATLASATITGDLTVDTSTLKVNSSANRVGVLTASPESELDVRGLIAVRGTPTFPTTGVGPELFWSPGNSNSNLYSYNRGTSAWVEMAYGALNHNFQISGSTAMTLNSTGLGVKGSPISPLTAYGATVAKAPVMLLTTVGSPDYGWDFSVDGAVNGNMFIRRLVAGTKTDVLEFDRATGNVGIGVTPSAWVSTFKAINVSSYAAFGGNSDDKLTLVGNNYYNDGTAKFIGNGYAGAYSIYQGAHRFQISTTNNSSGAGAALTFTQAMTLDASGRLILLASTTTPATLSTNGQLTFTATSDTNLRFSYRGSDGVTRVANLTLA